LRNPFGSFEGGNRTSLSYQIGHKFKRVRFQADP
jgi:hypothetical protein